MGATTTTPQECGAVVVRYQDNSNFYLIKPTANQLILYEKLNGNLQQRSVATLPGGAITPNTWYNLKVTAEQGKLTVYWQDQYVTEWTDGSPWLSGKVGFWHYGLLDIQTDVRWRKVSVTTGGPGQVITAEDYDPWGIVLDNRSYVSGNPDTRYKFTEKERDAESGYDYFGARYYDSRIGRWMSVDPLAAIDPIVSPFVYCGNNPVIHVDPDGRIFDTRLDIAFVAYDVYDIAKSVVKGEGVSATQGLALGADVACAILPFATGGGAAVRGASAAEHAIAEATKIEKVAEAVKVAEKVEDAAKAADKAADVTKAVHGNSATSTKAQHNYDIVDTWNDKVVKTGTSSGKETRAGESYRSNPRRTNGTGRREHRAATNQRRRTEHQQVQELGQKP
jgi:RHS repeat-associated protein